jgi:hypothetical protein
MQMVISRLGMLRRFGQKLGPYLVLEILLPGGTLLALLLYLYQRRIDIRTVASSASRAMTRALASVVEGVLVPRPCYLRPSRVFQPVVRERRESNDLRGNRRFR